MQSGIPEKGWAIHDDPREHPEFKIEVAAMLRNTPGSI